eukprot:2960471-Rhodomonas_salina.2
MGGVRRRGSRVLRETESTPRHRPHLYIVREVAQHELVPDLPPRATSQRQLPNALGQAQEMVAGGKEEDGRTQREVVEVRLAGGGGGRGRGCPCRSEVSLQPAHAWATPGVGLAGPAQRPALASAPPRPFPTPRCDCPRQPPCDWRRALLPRLPRPPPHHHPPPRHLRCRRQGAAASASSPPSPRPRQLWFAPDITTSSVCASSYTPALRFWPELHCESGSEPAGKGCSSSAQPLWPT